jgi:hypothetical protein
MVSAAMGASIRNVYDLAWWASGAVCLLFAAWACNERHNGLNPIEDWPIIGGITPMRWLIIGAIALVYFSVRSSQSNARAAAAEQRAEQRAAAAARREQVDIAAEAQLKALRQYEAEVYANRGQ